jgi:hypothetical protein
LGCRQLIIVAASRVRRLPDISESAFLACPSGQIWSKRASMHGTALGVAFREAWIRTALGLRKPPRPSLNLPILHSLWHGRVSKCLDRLVVRMRRGSFVRRRSEMWRDKREAAHETCRLTHSHGCVELRRRRTRQPPNAGEPAWHNARALDQCKARQFRKPLRSGRICGWHRGRGRIGPSKTLHRVRFKTPCYLPTLRYLTSSAFRPAPRPLV